MSIRDFNLCLDQFVVLQSPSNFILPKPSKELLKISPTAPAIFFIFLKVLYLRCSQRKRVAFQWSFIWRNTYLQRRGHEISEIFYSVRGTSLTLLSLVLTAMPIWEVKLFLCLDPTYSFAIALFTLKWFSCPPTSASTPHKASHPVRKYDIETV